MLILAVTAWCGFPAFLLAGLSFASLRVLEILFPSQGGNRYVRPPDYWPVLLHGEVQDDPLKVLQLPKRTVLRLHLFDPEGGIDLFNARIRCQEGNVGEAWHIALRGKDDNVGLGNPLALNGPLENDIGVLDNLSRGG